MDNYLTEAQIETALASHTQKPVKVYFDITHDEVHIHVGPEHLIVPTSEISSLDAFIAAHPELVDG